MSYAKGDRVRVTIEVTVDEVGLFRDWMRVRTLEADAPGPITLRTGGKGITIERLPPPPEPLYVNAPEITEPEVGDIVRCAEDVEDERLWRKINEGDLWQILSSLPSRTWPRIDLPKHLTLLVRGGKVWPS